MMQYRTACPGLKIRTPLVTARDILLRCQASEKFFSWFLNCKRSYVTAYPQMSSSVFSPVLSSKLLKKAHSVTTRSLSSNFIHCCSCIPVFMFSGSLLCGDYDLVYFRMNGLYLPHFTYNSSNHSILQLRELEWEKDETTNGALSKTFS